MSDSEATSTTNGATNESNVVGTLQLGNGLLIEDPEFPSLSPQEQLTAIIYQAKKQGYDVTCPEDDDVEDAIEVSIVAAKEDTIVPHKIFKLFNRPEIKDAVENRLFSDENLNTVTSEELIWESSKFPFKSLLAATNPVNIHRDISDIETSQKNINDKIFVLNTTLNDRNQLKEPAKTEIAKAEKEVEELASKLAKKIDEVQDRKTDYDSLLSEIDTIQSKIETLAKDSKVADHYKNALVQLQEFRTKNPFKLPYATINNREDVKSLAASCGVREPDDIPKLREEEHVAIATVCALYGYPYSMTFSQTGITEGIRLGVYKIEEMQEQTARLFLMHKEDATGKRTTVSSAIFSPRKRAKVSCKSIMSPELKAFLRK